MQCGSGSELVKLVGVNKFIINKLINRLAELT